MLTNKVYTPEQIAIANKVAGRKAARFINNRDFHGLVGLLNRVCRTIPLVDDLFDDDFVKAIVQNRMGVYGNDELRALGRAYFTEFEEKTKTKKEITTACGAKKTITTVKCMEPHDSQVLDEYVDYLTTNIAQNLSVSFSEKELMDLSCGEDTFLALQNLVRSKVNASVFQLIDRTMLCKFNDASNAKKIAIILACCNKCEGRSFISALNTFVLKLQRNLSAYNLAGRDYDLKVNNMWLLKSYELDSRMIDVFSNTFSSDQININKRFDKAWPIDITIADGIIADKKAIQFHEVVNRQNWTIDNYFMTQCVTVNYIAKFAITNFLLWAPFKIVTVGCDQYKEIKILDNKIESSTAKYTVTDQNDAETQIKAAIDAMKASESKLVLKYTFSDYVAPVAGTEGSIKVSVDISNETGDTVSIANNQFALTLKTRSGSE